MIREYSIPSIDGKNGIYVFNIENEGTVTHHGGDKTTLLMGRIMKMREGATVSFDSANFLSFEIPYGTELTEQLLTKAMRQYEQEIQAENGNSSSHYIGRLTKDEKGEFVYGNKSKVVEGKVTEIVHEQIQKREEQRRRNRAENAKNSESADRRAMYRTSLSAREHLAGKAEERTERKAHPFLTKDKYPLGGTNYIDYTGVDMHTGDILRIRHVDKIGKDGSGTYLYSAYIERRANEDDVEFVDVEEGPYSFVCFELQKRLEDIVCEQKQQEVTTLLELLSDDRAFENRDTLTYLGEIDKSEQVKRREKSTSNAIQARIEFMKKQYEEARQKRIQENRRDLYK